jgi:hypothetical protein
VFPQAHLRRRARVDYLFHLSPSSSRYLLRNVHRTHIFASSTLIPCSAFISICSQSQLHGRHCKLHRKRQSRPIQQPLRPGYQHLSRLLRLLHARKRPHRMRQTLRVSKGLCYSYDIAMEPVTPLWDTDQAEPPETHRASLGSRVAPYIYPRSSLIRVP